MPTITNTGQETNQSLVFMIVQLFLHVTRFYLCFLRRNGYIAYNLVNITVTVVPIFSAVIAYRLLAPKLWTSFQRVEASNTLPGRGRSGRRGGGHARALGRGGRRGGIHGPGHGSVRYCC